MENISGWDLYHYQELTSTNTQAEIISHKVFSGRKFVVTTTNQTQGRGRLGRTWVPSAGNLYFSQCFEVSLSNLGQIIFVSSLSLAETIKEYNKNLSVEIKWPNDILVENAKISGTLLEKGAGEYLVIGIGVNISSSPHIENTTYNITSLKDVGISTNNYHFLSQYLHIFNKNYRLWIDYGFTTIKNKWLNFAKGIGSEIFVRGINSEKSGVFIGIDENGLLLLKKYDKIEKICAGDVFYLNNSEGKI